MDALDQALPGGMDGRLMTDGFAVFPIVRRTAGGRTAGVFLLNLSIGETPELEFAIRRPAYRKYRLRRPGKKSAWPQVVREDAEEIVLRLPPLFGWQPMLLEGSGRRGDA